MTDECVTEKVEAVSLLPSISRTAEAEEVQSSATGAEAVMSIPQPKESSHTVQEPAGTPKLSISTQTFFPQKPKPFHNPNRFLYNPISLPQPVKLRSNPKSHQSTLLLLIQNKKKLPNLKTPKPRSENPQR